MSAECGPEDDIPADSASYLEIIRESEFFDSAWYRQTYRDVEKSSRKSIFSS